MKKALLAVAALTCMGTAAFAGPNAGGTLIVALSQGTVYSPDIDYCGSATTPTCEDAVTQAASDGVTVVLNVLAAFNAPGGRLAGITWGMTYSSNVAIVDYGQCGDFELPNADWPASGSGTAITWAPAETSMLVPVYWLAAYGYNGPGSIVLGGHPSQGGNFGDDSVPSVLDPIAGYGSFGFGMPGSVVCPQGQPDPTGACCIGFDCTVRTAADCEAAGGIYLGDDVPCEPGTCGVEPGTGACCVPGAVCFVTTEDDCARQGGVYQGDDTTCQPDPCVPIPTIDTSWGAVKGIYR